MPSRRDSLTRLDTELKSWAKRVPESHELYAILTGLVNVRQHEAAAKDRTAAITAAAFIDFALQGAISLHLPDSTERQKKDLFDGGGAGPLSSISAKILMAHALGIISDIEREDLDTIRIIRNNFAHSMIHMEFSDEAVSKECSALHEPDEGSFMSRIQWEDDPKSRFVYTVGALFFRLSIYQQGFSLLPRVRPESSP
jgi:hypothetical protein